MAFRNKTPLFVACTSLLNLAGQTQVSENTRDDIKMVCKAQKMSCHLAVSRLQTWSPCRIQKSPSNLFSDVVIQNCPEKPIIVEIQLPLQLSIRPSAHRAGTNNYPTSFKRYVVRICEWIACIYSPSCSAVYRLVTWFWSVGLHRCTSTSCLLTFILDKYVFQQFFNTKISAQVWYSTP